MNFKLWGEDMWGVGPKVYDSGLNYTRTCHTKSDKDSRSLQHAVESRSALTRTVCFHHFTAWLGDSRVGFKLSATNEEPRICPARDQECSILDIFVNNGVRTSRGGSTAEKSSENATNGRSDWTAHCPDGSPEFCPCQRTILGFRGLGV